MLTGVIGVAPQGQKPFQCLLSASSFAAASRSFLIFCSYSVSLNTPNASSRLNCSHACRSHDSSSVVIEKGLIALACPILEE